MSDQTPASDRRKGASAPPLPAGASVSGVEELTTTECWALVESSTLGRLAVQALDGHPDVFPVNFLVHNGNLFIRSGPGKKLRSMAHKPAVAFEVDGADERYHWSVVIRATAERMATDAEIRESGILDLVSQSPTPKHDFVRLTPVTVTGRRFPQEAESTGAPAERASSQTDVPARRTPAGGSKDANRQKLDKPQPIPHFTPPTR